VHDPFECAGDTEVSNSVVAQPERTELRGRGDPVMTLEVDEQLSWEVGHR